MDLLELEAFGKTIKDKRTYRRYLCIWLKEAEGKTAQQIALQVGYHWRHVQRIQQKVRKADIQALLPVLRVGNHRLLSPEKEQEVLNSVEGAITIHPIVEAFSKAVGRELKDKTVYAILKRHRWKAKRPRPQHPKASPEAQQLFKKPA